MSDGKNGKGWRVTCFVTVRLIVMIFIADTVCAMNARTVGMPWNAKQQDALKILLSMRESYKDIDGYTAVMVKGEPQAGKSNASQKIFVKFKKPFKVYMKWIGDKHAGREVLYVQGENNDNLFAKPDGFLGNILRMVKLPSTHRSDGSRHTVKDVGIGKLVESILDITLQAKRKNDLNLVCNGVVVRNGRKAYEIERFLPQDKDCYEYKRVVMYVDTATKLPLEVYAYGKDGKLKEFCVYQDITLNPSLKDTEFTVNNKEYGFRYL
ncbi:MAG TPA: DUF1571 domain-containing protein [bacterium]|nr:DUF1571 domain-containing protein [bacterium]